MKICCAPLFVRLVLTGLVIRGVLLATSSIAGPLDDWTWRNPSPQADPLAAMVYGNGTFVGIVAIPPGVVTSSDGVSWVYHKTNGLAQKNNAVAFGNSLFVAVGDNGVIETSPDGVNWVARQSGVSSPLQAIAYGNGVFVAVGGATDGGPVAGPSAIVSSTDGISWVVRDSKTTNGISGVTFGNGRFVAVAGSFFGPQVTSATTLVSTDGVNWTANDVPDGFVRVVAGPGIFVAIGNTFDVQTYRELGLISTSPDGQTWTSRKTGINGVTEDIAFGGDKYVVTLDNATDLTSTDAINWQAGAGLGTDNWRVVFGNGQFVGFGGYAGSAPIGTSSNGSTWQIRTHDVGAGFLGMTYNQGLFVGVGWDGVYTSGDGVSWTKKQSTARLSSVAYGNGVFAAVGSGLVVNSNDGALWTKRSVFQHEMASISYGNGKFVAVGGDETTGAVVATSNNGADWTETVLQGLRQLTAISFGNGLFVAVEGGGQQGVTVHFLSSSDGITWTSHDTGENGNLTSITFGDGRFVAVGTDTNSRATAYTSLDGNLWLSHSLELYYKTLRALAYGDGVFVAVGDGVNGPVQETGTQNFVSADGITWVPRFSGTSHQLNSICFGNDTFVESGSFFADVTLQTNQLTQSGLPSILVGPVGQTVATGETVVLSVAATSQTAMNYQWQFNGVDLAGETAKTLVLTGINSSQAGLYTVKITNVAGAVTSDPAAIVVCTKFLTINTTPSGGGYATGAGGFRCDSSAGIAISATPGWRISGVQVESRQYLDDIERQFILHDTSGNAGGLTTLSGGVKMDRDKVLNVTFASMFPAALGNISTRLQVGKDDNVLFEGFIVQGPAGSTKKIMVRALGPFLAGFGVPDTLANPTLDIFEGNNKVAANNDWGTTQTGGLITGDQSAEIAASGLAPSNGLESAIIANLAPGAYTAIVRGLGNTVGIGLVDAFDLSAASPAKVVNFATRGLVQPGDKLLTAGFIIQDGSVRAVIRAIGPSLAAFNITNALPDTTLQLRDQNGGLVQENDDWETDQKQELLGTGLQPSNAKEAALVRTIPPGQYTAQVRGKPEATGVGVVEVYFIP